MRVTNDFFPWFPPEEYERRHAVVREAIRARGLAALLIHGTRTYIGTDGGHPNVAWVAATCAFFSSYVVFPLDGEPTFVGFGPWHIGNNRAMSVLREFRPGGKDPVPAIVGRLQEVGAARGRLGLVGSLAALEPESLPLEHYERLRKALPEVEFEDATQWYEDLRLVKSPPEVEALRKAAAITDRAQQALLDAARPGVTPARLATVALTTVHAAGGRSPYTHIGATPMAAPTRSYPDPYPVAHPLERGDVLLTETVAGYSGYFGKLHTTTFLGEPPSAYREIFALAAGVYGELLTSVRPGQTVREVLALARRFDGAGLTMGIPVLEGWSTYQTRPYTGWPRPASEVDLGFELRPGHAVTLVAHPVTPDRRRGVWVGGLCLVTETGVEPLHRFAPQDLRVL
ncbi:MAG: aminopeptidase P family protein [Deltaproteobacteria bacterium]|nr:aminopeptidase P family protein [Deltaproteobacteria bacterium]